MEKKEASFRFKGYKILKSTIEFTGREGSNTNLDIKITPSGKLWKDKFDLTLDTSIQDEEKDLIIRVVLLASFDYNNINEESLKGFLCINAPAIVFPYIRAYISTLSALSGVGTIMLPTLNMSSMADELMSNLVRE